MPLTTQNAPSPERVTESAQELEPFGKRIMLTLFWLGTVGLSSAFVLAMFARFWWFADLFTHFRVQGFVLGLLLLYGCNRRLAFVRD